MKKSKDEIKEGRQEHEVKQSDRLKKKKKGTFCYGDIINLDIQKFDNGTVILV